MTLHVVVTDSGFGGMSLVGRLEGHLRRTGHAGGGASITYVNACPDDALGYNQMGSLARKRQTFARVLTAIERRFAPDAVVVACHTLCTLLDASGGWPGSVRGILEAGHRLLASTLCQRPQQRVLVLGTATTVAAKPWSTRLAAPGVPEDRLVYRACPGLETLISNDEDERALPLALEAVAVDVRGQGIGAVLLGCTHYSLRASAFAAAFGGQEPGLEVLDPVEELAAELLEPLASAADEGPARRDLRVRFVTRYAPPSREVSTIAARLAAIAPSAAAAVVGYQLEPDLFEVAPA